MNEVIVTELLSLSLLGVVVLLFEPRVLCVTVSRTEHEQKLLSRSDEDV